MRKPLTTAAWSAIIGIVLGLLGFIVSLLFGESSVGAFFAGAISLIGTLFYVLFLYGYVVLGKKFNVALLQVMAWIGIVLMIIFGVFGFIGSIASLAGAQGGIGLVDSNAGATALFALLIAFWVVFALIFGAYSVLFGVGILKLGNKIKYAKTAGILKIIAGATLVIFVGIFVGIVAYIFEIMLMFNAARKFER